MSEWTYNQAEQFLTSCEDKFTDCDLIPRIVGSVLIKGASDNDLDIALSPLNPITLEDGIKAFERLLSLLGIGNRIDHDYLFNPAADDDHGWFANTLWPDGRVVEFYFPAAEFPVGDDEDADHASTPHPSAYYKQEQTKPNVQPDRY